MWRGSSVSASQKTYKGKHLLPVQGRRVRFWYAEKRLRQSEDCRSRFVALTAEMSQSIWRNAYHFSSECGRNGDKCGRIPKEQRCLEIYS